MTVGESVLVAREEHGMATAEFSVHQLQPGEPVQIQDARGDWHDAVTLSTVEGTHHGGGPKVHNFPIIWVEATGANGKPFKAPWPIESVRAAAPVGG
jgi:hypothetical protein